MYRLVSIWPQTGCDHYRCFDGGIQILMETLLSSIATRVLQPPEELGEVQPSRFFRHHRCNRKKDHSQMPASQ